MLKKTNKYVARQAILSRDKSTYGYELLYRDSPENIFRASESELATSQVIIQNHILGDLTHLCLGKKAFINFDETTILERSPLLLDKDIVVIEFLETITITDQIVAEAKLLKSKGYSIAIDDYNLAPQWRKLVKMAFFTKS